MTPDLPSDTVQAVRKLHLAALVAGPDSADCNTFCYFVRRLFDAGWSWVAISRALGISRQAVSMWGKRGSTACDTPAVPSRPVPPPVLPRQRKPLIAPTPQEIDRLRALWEVAKDVNGGCRSDDPRRAISVELTALMAALVERGMTPYRLGKLMGLTINGVKYRLARHGFWRVPPSLASTRYQGRATFEPRQVAS